MDYQMLYMQVLSVYISHITTECSSLLFMLSLQQKFWQ